MTTVLVGSVPILFQSVVGTAYKTWLAARSVKHHGTGPTLARASIKNRLVGIGLVFERLIEWGADDAPTARLLYADDLPIVDKPLPRFIDDAASARSWTVRWSWCCGLPPRVP